MLLLKTHLRHMGRFSTIGFLMIYQRVGLELNTRGKCLACRFCLISLGFVQNQPYPFYLSYRLLKGLIAV